jgi:hypothetical protein
MHGKPPRDGSMSNWPRGCGLCLLAMTVMWLSSALPASADAAACPNAQVRSGASEHLPDCRAYEQVSPVEKDGGDAVALVPLKPAQSGPCQGGETCTLAYMNVGTAFAGALGNALPNAYLATRGEDGWQTTPITPPTPHAPANSPAKVSYAFSGDLSQAILRVPPQQLTEGAPEGVYNLYVRGSSGGYSLVTAAVPSELPLANCGGCYETEDVPAYAGASSDFSHVIFEANDSLVAGAPGAHVENLYEESSGHVSLVGVLPDGAIPPQGATAGGGIQVVGERAHELDHAISQDGSHVLFEARADAGGPEPEQSGTTELYDRIDGARTVEVSAPAPGASVERCETAGGLCNAGPAQFWAASADGSAVYFTSKAALTRESFTGAEQPATENPGNDLYRYEVGTGTLTDLTVDSDNANDPNGADVLGVVGTSEDGSYVYFVAEGEFGELGGPREGTRSGHPNLYVWHETLAGADTVKFIATLAAPSPEEQEKLEMLQLGHAFEYDSDLGDWTSRPIASQAYVTPNGESLAFMSVEPLTGYDNEDGVTGKSDHEVFEYDAETGRLVCVSCDPGGAPPLGSAFIGAGLQETASTPFHQPRSVSDDGSRVFFTSPDPLVPGVFGGSDKVYEYEDGEPLLISGTEGGGSSVFLDASASGDDLFFATRERLVSSDVDELVDVYDARVDGGFPTSAALAPCKDSACQEPFSQPPLFSTPISAAFTGPGNLPAPALPARLTRKQLLARALVRCRRLTNRKQRARCRAAADRRYATVARKARRGRVATRRRSRG